MERGQETKLLNTKDKEIFDHICIILDGYYDAVSKDKMTREKFNSNLTEIDTLTKKLESEGYRPGDYFLYHKLFGSTVNRDEVPFFDTSDAEIERFIIDNFKV